MLLACLLALTACGVSTGSGVRLTAADAALTKPCDPPVLIPVRELTEYETNKYWSVDRTRLVKCSAKDAELVRYYDDLFKRIGKKK